MDSILTEFLGFTHFGHFGPTATHGLHYRFVSYDRHTSSLVQ